MQDDALQQVMNIVGCGRSTARALLMHFCWNVDSLCGKPRNHPTAHASCMGIPIFFAMSSEKALAVIRDK